MEHHQHELPEDKKPLITPDNKNSVTKKPKKRRKIRRPAFNIDRYLPNKDKPTSLAQAELWAWPRLKPKPEQKLDKSLEAADTAVLDETTKPPPTEVIYQEEEFSEELSLKENSQFITIPLSSYVESEILLHSYSEEIDESGIDLSVAEAKPRQAADSRLAKSTEQLPVADLSSANISPVSIAEKSDINSDINLPVVTDVPGEQTIPLPASQSLEAVVDNLKTTNYNNESLNKPALDNTLENAQSLANFQDTTFDPNLIRANDYQARPEMKTPTTPPGIVAEASISSKLISWWRQLRKPQLLSFYHSKSSAQLVPPATATKDLTEQASPYARNYEPNLFRRTIGRRPAVSEFVKQLKANAQQSIPNNEPMVMDHSVAARPIESISQLISNFQPQLAEAGGATVGSMNYILKSTPYYPEHYQRNDVHEPVINIEAGDASVKPEDQPSLARLQVAEDRVIPSAVENNLFNKTNLTPAPESTSLSDKSWDEIVAIEAERLRIASQRRPENFALTANQLLESTPKPNTPEYIQPPDMPPELPPNRQVQNSVWHRIEVDNKTGRVVETPTLAYGQAFRQEQLQEMQPPPADTTAASGQLAVSTTTQIDLPQPSPPTTKVESANKPDSQLLPNQLESTIRVRQSANLNFTDLWLWIILIIVILALIIAIDV